MLKSIFQQRGKVTFPAFAAISVYMLPFMQKEGLPDHLSSWQPTVDQMLEGIHTDQPLYLMIDQSFVPAGGYQRRPGVHIDGYWVPEISAHGGHASRPGHLGSPTRPGHQSHRSNRGTHLSSWSDSDYAEPEALLLASNYAACRAYEGVFDGKLKEGGNAEAIDLTQLTPVDCEANRVYAGNVTMLHETLAVKEDVYRTLVRINAPGVIIQ